jgi:Xaa-Pro aminopeptidase
MSKFSKKQCVIKGIKIAGKVYKDIIGFIRPGITEKDVARLIARKIKEYGGDGIAFRTIVASGKRSALIHGRATDKKIKSGDAILLDYGVKYQGYCCDVSRTMFLGSITAKQRELYKLVLKAQAKAVLLLAAGMKCSEVDLAARTVIEKAGYGKKFPHSTGHGLGKKIHTGPKLGKKNPRRLKEGDIVTVEPGIYIKGFGGVRIEDDYIIEARGAKCITALMPKEKPFIIKVEKQ